MSIKITPFGTPTNTQGAQILEFNIGIPGGARTDVAPISTLTITSRWRETQGNTHVTKLDLIHTLQYVDCKGATKVITTPYSTIMADENPTKEPEAILKYVDILIPKGVDIVTQQVIDNVPTVTAQVSHCAYSVFTISLPTVATPAASVKK